MKIRLTTTLALLTAWGLLSQCKLQTEEGEADPKAPVSPVGVNASITFEQAASGLSDINRIGDFFQLVTGDTYQRSLSALKLQAQTTRIPSSGSWYPYKAAGTNQKATPDDPRTALEKYDLVFNGGEFLATQWELANHFLPPENPAAEWAGHCNAVSAREQRHKEPRRSVVRNGVEFKPQDIKALMAAIYQDSDWVYVTGVRCNDASPNRNPLDRPSADTPDPCESNPGAFHLALGNWIGNADQMLIFDERAGEQLWNYPLYKYVSEVTEISQDRANLLLGVTGDTGFRFNPDAKSFRQVRTVIHYADVFDDERLGVIKERTDEYGYILELDEAGEVIGGEWIPSLNPKGPPDFIWLALEPLDPNELAQSFGNPHVGIEEVLALWAESVGEPEASRQPISRPDLASDLGWGNNGVFQVVLDGRKVGVAFLGKPIKVIVQRLANLDAAFFNVTLNEGERRTFEAKQGQEGVVFELDAKELRLGQNRLTVQFFREGVALEGGTQNLIFEGVY